MAVLKKIRSFRFGGAQLASAPTEQPNTLSAGLYNEYHQGLDYVIRPMTSEQIDECWRLDMRCFVDGEAYSRETFEYLLSTPEAISYCAASDHNQMIGFIIGLVEPDRTGHITTVAVAPEDRRRGIAERLMRRAEMALRARGVITMRLEVRDTNTAGVKLYHKLGFTVIHRLVAYYSNGGAGLLMVKSLN